MGSEQWFNTEFSLYNDISTFVSEYLNTSRAGVSWRSTAVDFYNATLVAKLYGSSSAYFGAQTARRGFTAQAAAQYPQYTFAKYELVEIMQNASIADAGSFYCELNSDQPAAIYQAREHTAAHGARRPPPTSSARPANTTPPLRPYYYDRTWPPCPAAPGPGTWPTALGRRSC